MKYYLFFVYLTEKKCDITGFVCSFLAESAIFIVEHVKEKSYDFIMLYKMLYL